MELTNVKKPWCLVVVALSLGCSRNVASDGDIIGRWIEKQEEYLRKDRKRPNVLAGKDSIWIQFDKDHTFRMMPFNWNGTWRISGAAIICRPKQFYLPLEILRNHRDRNSKQIHDFSLLISKSGQELRLQLNSGDPQNIVTLVYTKH